MYLSESSATPLSPAPELPVEKRLALLAGEVESLEVPDAEGYTALMRAVLGRRLDLARLLLACGCNPRRRSPRLGRSALDLAVATGFSAAIPLLRGAG